MQDHDTEVFTAFDFCILPTKKFSIQGFWIELLNENDNVATRTFFSNSKQKPNAVFPSQSVERRFTTIDEAWFTGLYILQILETKLRASWKVLAARCFNTIAQITSKIIDADN